MSTADTALRARRVFGAGLGQVARWAAAGESRLTPPQADIVQPLPSPGPDTLASPPSYGPLWNPRTDDDAISQISGTADWRQFEAAGREDEARLAPFYDESSIVLDLGCGIGRVAQFVAPKCRQLWAVDASQRMLDITSRRLSMMTNISFARCLDVAVPDVPDESIDLAYSIQMLEHVEREDAFLLLEELRRVLRPSGTVVVTFPNLLSDMHLDAFVTCARARAIDVHRARAYTLEEVSRIMEAAGFLTKLDDQPEICAFGHPV
ncbi:MAG: methyltransferase domain-containing protein [Acidimicrobiaceae bacterium]|nr:methyltransferase domain-containing protein [Acidimicrobiaceae bacterium]